MKRLALALLLALVPFAAFAQDVINPQTNASALTTGTVTAARGGAGTVTGALKGSGAGVVSQAACADLSNSTAYCSATQGQLPGIASNTAASAGNVGEYISSTVLVGSAVALANITAKDVTTVTLSAGEWICNGNVAYSPAGGTTSTVHTAWISTTANTNPTVPNGGSYNQDQVSYAAGAGPVMPTGAFRVLASGGTVISLGAFANFAVSTMSAYGFLGCVRTH